MVFDITQLRKIRKQLDMTQHKFAMEIGVSQSMIAKIEAGKLDPTYSYVKKIEDRIMHLTKRGEKEAKDIKTDILSGKAVIGKEAVLKSLKNKKLSKVYLASNCPDELKKDIEYYSKLTGTKVIVLDKDNEELGILCKKNFFVSILGILGDKIGSSKN